MHFSIQKDVCSTLHQTPTTKLIEQTSIVWYFVHAKLESNLIFFGFQGLLATREQLCPAWGERRGDPLGSAQRQSHPLGVPLPGDREPPPRPKRQLRHTQPGQKPSPGLHTLTHQLSYVDFITTFGSLKNQDPLYPCVLCISGIDIHIFGLVPLAHQYYSLQIKMIQSQ